MGLAAFQLFKKSMWTFAAVVTRISGRDLLRLASRAGVLVLDNRIIDAREINLLLWRSM
jgi:hypothetical protein